MFRQEILWPTIDENLCCGSAKFHDDHQQEWLQMASAHAPHLECHGGSAVRKPSARDQPSRAVKS